MSHSKIKGTLIPIGGNEDKGIEENEKYTLEFIQEGILYHVVQQAGEKMPILLLFQQRPAFLLKWAKITYQHFRL